jgi:hypothetical protein
MADKPKGPPPPPSDRDRASASGIPLQRHLAELVNKTCDGRDQTHPDDRQLWRVEAEEVPAGDGFLDSRASSPLKNSSLRNHSKGLVRRSLQRT